MSVAVDRLGSLMTHVTAVEVSHDVSDAVHFRISILIVSRPKTDFGGKLKCNPINKSLPWPKKTNAKYCNKQMLKIEFRRFGVKGFRHSERD